jgi:hypothetical protein
MNDYKFNTDKRELWIELVDAANNGGVFSWRRAADKAREVITGEIVAFLRKPHEDGTQCSAEREMLAQHIERGEHLK